MTTLSIYLAGAFAVLFVTGLMSDEDKTDALIWGGLTAVFWPVIVLVAIGSICGAFCVGFGRVVRGLFLALFAR